MPATASGGGERQLEGAERLAELIAPARADERHHVVAAFAHPGEGELRGRGVLLARDRAERLHQRHVAGKVLVGKARHAGADFTGLLGSLRAVANQAARKHAIGDERDAELAHGRQNLLLDVAADERIFNLQRRDRMHRVRPADRFRRRFRQPDVTDIAGLDHVGDGADRVLDRHRGIEPRGLIEIDMVGAETPQAVGEKILHRDRPDIVAEKFQVRAAHRPELERDEGALALAAPERLADEHLVVSRAVEVAGVEHGDAGFERGMDGGDRLGIVGRPVAARHAHAAEPHFGDFRTIAAKAAGAHEVLTERYGLSRSCPRKRGTHRATYASRWNTGPPLARGRQCHALLDPCGLGVGAGGRTSAIYSAARRTSGAAERTSASTCFSYLTKFSWNMRTSLRAVSSNAALSFQVLIG